MKMATVPSKVRWDKEHTVFIGIRFQRKVDQDCIDFLEGKNKRDTVCKALREYMKNHPDKEPVSWLDEDDE